MTYLNENDSAKFMRGTINGIVLSLAFFWIPLGVIVWSNWK
jgi:hypothetical protein